MDWSSRIMETYSKPLIGQQEYLKIMLKFVASTVPAGGIDL